MKRFLLILLFISLFSNYLLTVDNKIINLAQINKPNENLDIDENETYSVETFKELIQQKAAAGSQYIIARVETASNDPARPYVHYLDAHGLLQDNILGYPADVNIIDQAAYKHFDRNLGRHILRNPLNRGDILDIEFLQINNAAAPEFQYLFSLNDLKSNNAYFLNYLKDNHNNVVQVFNRANVQQAVLTPAEIYNQAYALLNVNNAQAQALFEQAFNQNIDMETKAMAAAQLAYIFAYINMDYPLVLQYLNYLENQNDSLDLKNRAQFMLGTIYLNGFIGVVANHNEAKRYFELAAAGDGAFAGKARNKLQDFKFREEIKKIRNVANRLINQKNNRAKAANKQQFDQKIRNLKRRLVNLDLNRRNGRGQNFLMTNPRLILILCDLPAQKARQLATASDNRGFKVKRYLINSQLPKNNPALFIRLLVILKNCGKIVISRQDLNRLKNRVGNRRFVAIMNILKQQNII